MQAGESMARQLRTEYEGTIYHVMSRGDGREPIFEDIQDRERFLKTLGHACDKAEWQIHAYCLMGNHFHIVMETPKPTLVAGMKWFPGTYAQRYNSRHRVRGHLFSGRYKSLLADGSIDDFFGPCLAASTMYRRAAGYFTSHGQSQGQSRVSLRASRSTAWGSAFKAHGFETVIKELVREVQRG